MFDFREIIWCCPDFNYHIYYGDARYCLCGFREKRGYPLASGESERKRTDAMDLFLQHIELLRK